MSCIHKNVSIPFLCHPTCEQEDTVCQSLLSYDDQSCLRNTGSFTALSSIKGLLRTDWKLERNSEQDVKQVEDISYLSFKMQRYETSRWKSNDTKNEWTQFLTTIHSGCNAASAVLEYNKGKFAVSALCPYTCLASSLNNGMTKEGLFNNDSFGFASTTSKDVYSQLDNEKRKRRQEMKRLWGQKDQMRNMEARKLLQVQEASLQSALLELLNKRKDLSVTSFQIYMREMWSYTDEEEVRMLNKLPVLHTSAWDAVERQRHRISSRAAPHSLSDLSTDVKKKRRNLQKSVSKRRTLEFQKQRMELLRWNHKALELLWKHFGTQAG